MNPVKLSVVIPIYNERDSILPLCHSLRQVMCGLNQRYEVIIVNDGSSDGSIDELRRLDCNPRDFIIVDLKMNKGKSLALQAGFDIAQGEYIITMDGDLQNDPADIPKLLDRIKEGFDVVCGWRYQRKDSWSKVQSARVACIVRRTIFGERIHDVGCALRVFKKDTLKNVFLSGRLHRYLTLVMLKAGYKIGEVRVAHHRRIYGKTKYGISKRLFEGIIDLLLLCLFDVHKLTGRRQDYEIREIIKK